MHIPLSRIREELRQTRYRDEVVGADTLSIAHHDKHHCLWAVSRERVCRFYSRCLGRAVSYSYYSTMFYFVDHSAEAIVDSRNGEPVRERVDLDLCRDCDNCGCTTLGSVLYDTRDEELVCPRCYRNYYTQCECSPGCCCLIAERNDCTDGEDERSLIKSYDANVLHIFGNVFKRAPQEAEHKNKIYFGVELEVEPRTVHQRAEIAQAVQESLRDFVILKNDSSLSHGGFEIVSLPASHLYHKTAWDPFFAGPARNVRGWTASQAGMHVHISLTPLSRLQRGRMGYFINSAENRGFIEAVAGRSEPNYARLYDKPVSRAGRRRYSSHHDGLSFNTSNPDDTCELRIFRSNVAREGFLKNLDFTAAFVEFCGITSNNALGYKDFLEWLASSPRHKLYSYLVRWLIQHNYIEAAALHGRAKKIPVAEPVLEEMRVDAE